MPDNLAKARTTVRPGPVVTALFLYLLGLLAAFVVLNVLLHRQVRSDRRRERAAAGSTPSGRRPPENGDPPLDC